MGRDLFLAIGVIKAAPHGSSNGIIRCHPMDLVGYIRCIQTMRLEAGWGQKVERYHNTRVVQHCSLFRGMVAKHNVFVAKFLSDFAVSNKQILKFIPIIKSNLSILSLTLVGGNQLYVGNVFMPASREQFWHMKLFFQLDTGITELSPVWKRLVYNRGPTGFRDAVSMLAQLPGRLQSYKPMVTKGGKIIGNLTLISLWVVTHTRSGPSGECATCPTISGRTALTFRKNSAWRSRIAGS